MGKTFCYKCGSIIPDGALRCPNCGSPAPLSSAELAKTSSRTFRSGAPIPEQANMSAGSRTSPAAEELASVTEKITPQAQQSVKTETIKAESVKTETVKVETVKTESVKTEPVKIEPVKTEPVSPVPAAPAKPVPAPARPVKAPAKPSYAVRSGATSHTWSSRGVLIGGIAAIVILLIIFAVSRLISSDSEEPMDQILNQLSYISPAWDAADAVELLSGSDRF